MPRYIRCPHCGKKTSTAFLLCRHCGRDCDNPHHWLAKMGEDDEQRERQTYSRWTSWGWVLLAVVCLRALQFLIRALRTGNQ